jgi:hypothetical protein
VNSEKTSKSHNGNSSAVTATAITTAGEEKGKERPSEEWKKRRGRGRERASDFKQKLWLLSN